MRQSEIDLFLPNCIIENDYMGQIRESERKNLKREKISEKVLFENSHIFATKEKITFYQMNSNSRLKVGKISKTSQQ